MSDRIHRRAEAPRSRLSSWLGWFGALLAEELAPRPRRLETSLRWTVIATIGAGLMAAAHVRSALGPYTVWLMIGPVAMMSPRRAIAYITITAPILAASVPLAGILSESPWLMLPFIGVFTGLSTYLINKHQLGSIGLLWQVITLDTFYGVVFAPRDFGWSAAATFGGCAIALILIAIFDTWIWPDPADAILLESLAASLERLYGRFVQTTAYYMDAAAAERPGEPPATSAMPVQLALLDRAAAEGMSTHRRAVLLGAINLVERLQVQVDRLTIAAREAVPRDVRTMVRPELQTVCSAIAALFEQLIAEARVAIRTGVDSPPTPAVVAVRTATDALDARVAAVRPSYINRASGAEVDNFGAFADSLHSIIRLIERPLDEPPDLAAVPMTAEVAEADPALLTYCLKVALCVVVGYVIGLITQRGDLSTILTTIIVAGLPTYGATLRKAILRIVGAVLGGAISLLAIIIATPNFETLPSYMAVTFVVLFISGYASLSSGRVAYAGKQIGTTFLLVFAELSPHPDIYSPLWRAWGILLGTVVVAVVFFIFYPVYAGDSLLPRLRKVIRATLLLIPGRAEASVGEIHRISDDITKVLSEILQVADDARLEGRRSLIDHDAVVQSAGTIRRIAHRLAALAVWRLTDPPPRLDDATEAAADATFSALRRRLEAWLIFFEGEGGLRGEAARALAGMHSRQEIAQPMQDFISRIEANGFARIAAWSIDQRRPMLAELQSLRRLEFLMWELDTFLARIPGSTTGNEAPYRAAVAVSRPA